MHIGTHRTAVTDRNRGSMKVTNACNAKPHNEDHQYKKHRQQVGATMISMRSRTRMIFVILVDEFQNTFISMFGISVAIYTLAGGDSCSSKFEGIVGNNSGLACACPVFAGPAHASHEIIPIEPETIDDNNN